MCVLAQPDKSRSFQQTVGVHRVHNLALPTTQLLGQVFKGADLDTQTNLSARRVCRDIPGGTLASCQDQLLRHCINQLFSYRKNCTTAPSSGQLILPEALKLLPFYSLGLSKSPCLRCILAYSLAAPPTTNGHPLLHDKSTCCLKVDI